MIAMALGVQINNVQQSEPSLMMENLEAIAMASSEGYPSDCVAVWDNVTCKSGGITYSYAKKI